MYVPPPLSSNAKKKKKLFRLRFHGRWCQRCYTPLTPPSGVSVYRGTHYVYLCTHSVNTIMTDRVSELCHMLWHYYNCRRRVLDAANNINRSPDAELHTAVAVAYPLGISEAWSRAESKTVDGDRHKGRVVSISKYDCCLTLLKKTTVQPIIAMFLLSSLLPKPS